jgi:hypothetical protein
MSDAFGTGQSTTVLGQVFRTITVPAILPALYQLSIRAPGGAFYDLATYTFPISPTSLRYEPRGMSRVTDVQGNASNYGVQRIVDVYGLSPPTIIIEGTTGWERHQTDGYALTGIESMQMLQAFLQKYAALNQQQRAAGNSQLYTLEFYDYYLSKFWVVEPVGPQQVRMSEDRARLAYYRFRWEAIRPAGLPILGIADAVLQVLDIPVLTAAAATASTLTGIVGIYNPSGPVT